MDLRELARSYLSKNDIAVNQVEYSLLERSIERDVLPHCIERRITVMAYTPLGMGKLSRNEFLQQLGKKYKKTAAQVALNWLIAKENVVAIAKAININHLEENAGAIGWRLAGDDAEHISSYFGQP